MGAYGQSRMREYLFGGVTRYFLETDSHLRCCWPTDARRLAGDQHAQCTIELP